ncbi:FAD-dependent monooxygenase [Rhodoferax sediminis]|uniref:Ubiquinone biosynthesis protein UbiH n=1 Tax=Rhodoferax sediminis TaxID=2509614 RepID=A0A515DF32_9BURK|nr:FAD-dependent monooxygenase [Rhodoferax sediminis]QDL39000.1 ubiquinone biosynthesis protein UbiH [Rhodoferax sediminis]
MAQPFDVCIRGAGVVGRTLALLLARDRLRVALVAGPTAPAAAATDVRAYALNAAARALLESLRGWPDDAFATAVLGMQVCGDDGGEVNFSAAAQGAPALAWIVDVPALEAQLAEAVRYQPLVEVVDAPPQSAALTVICEGRASSARAEFGVDFDVTPYPQRAIAARLVCEKSHGQIARQWFANNEILAFLPLGGDQGNSVAIVWSVPQERAAQLLALSPEEFARQLGVASHGALGALTLGSERAAWPLQLARAGRWVGTHAGKSWALAGDAAHTVHPLAGQGLNLGLADAAELAAVLHERDYWRSVGDLRLLRRYERARKVDVLSMGLATDGLQQLFARGAGPLQALRNWGMNGFERSGPLKTWLARQAMGLRRT